MAESVNTLQTDNSLARPIDDSEEKQLHEFRNRINELKSLSCPMDDVYLLRFLRYKKNSVDKAFIALQTWWNDRHNRLPELHDGLYPSVYADLYPKKYSTTLAKRDKLGRQILLWKPGNWNPKTTSFLEQFKSNFCIVDTISMRQHTQLQGVVVLYDLSGMGLSHVQACTPGNLRILLQLVDGFPMKVKGIHFVNHPAIFNVVYACAKTFMKPKMKQRVQFHGYNYASLHNHLEPEILPKRYGGLLEDGEFEEPNFIQTMMDREQYFRDLFDVYGYKN